mmetsp:Transcript_2403/g.9055  ORF Transcript_2403/g.9055 Transcript_2403/m.9055 type:complete len:286 (+) Transcript_2403:1313-2170(+)
MIRPSSAPVASLTPSTLHPTHVTLALWYTILSTTTVPAVGSQTSTSRFASHVASRVPSGEYAHAVTSPLCRVSVPPGTNEKEGRGSEPAPDSEPAPPDSEPAPASRATTEKRRTAPSLHPTATSRPSPRTQTLVGSRLIRPESASAVDATARVPRVPRVPSKVHAITPSPVATATNDPASSAPIERGCAGSFKLEPSPSTYDDESAPSMDATRIQSSNPAVTRYLPRTHTAPTTADVCPGPRTFATHPSPSRHRRTRAPPPIAESEAENASPELLHTASAPIGLG